MVQLLPYLSRSLPIGKENHKRGETESCFCGVGRGRLPAFRRVYPAAKPALLSFNLSMNHCMTVWNAGHAMPRCMARAG
jgi:hypothetical protein